MPKAQGATNSMTVPTEKIECPLCLGAGVLARAELLDRLDVRDFARVAQLSAEEAFRLLLQKQQQVGQNDWARFEAEITKRTSEIAERHREELHSVIARTKELASKPGATGITLVKRTISAAGRKGIAAAQRGRWAKLKASKKAA